MGLFFILGKSLQTDAIVSIVSWLVRNYWGETEMTTQNCANCGAMIRLKGNNAWVHMGMSTCTTAAPEVPPPQTPEEAYAQIERNIDILRGHAIAAALRRARPAPGAGSPHSWRQWVTCLRELESVVVSDHFPMSTFHNLCGWEN